MTKLASYFLDHPRITGMVVVLVFLAGILAAMTLNRQTQPPVSFDTLIITTIYPGASPEDVEVNVTRKIEKQLRTVSGIRKMSSLSLENLSQIIVELESSDPELRTDVRDAVDRVTDLPEAVRERPSVNEVDVANFPVIEVAFTGNAPIGTLQQFARDLEDRMKAISGVASVGRNGYRDREIGIYIDVEKMKQAQISFDQIAYAIGSRNIRATGGSLESYVSEKKIVTLSEFEKPEQVGGVILRSNFPGNSLTLGEIADIRDEFEKQDVLFRVNGHRAVGLSIVARGNSDVLDLSDEIHEEIENFRKGLPDNVQLIEVFDYSIYTRLMMDMVIYNGLTGFVLVFLVMVFFLDRTSALWSAFGIPFTILASLLIFLPLGINLNNITLATMILLIGILVDDAIVVTEKIFTLKKEGMPAHQAALEGVKTMARPVTAAVFTTILAFAPILFIGGIFGKFLASMPVIVGAMLLLSLIESLAILPAHLKNAKPPEQEPARAKWIQKLSDFYQDSIEKLLHKRAWVLGGFTFYFFAVIGLAAVSLDFMLNTEKDSDFFMVVIEGPTGYPLERTEELTAEVEKHVEKIIPAEYLKSYVTHVGHHDPGYSLGAAGRYSNWGMVMVYLIPAEDRDTESEYYMAELEKSLEPLRKDKERFHKLDVRLTGDELSGGKAIDVSYISDNDSLREQFEKETIEYLKTIEGVSAVESSDLPGKEELRLVFDYAKLASAGLNAAEVASTVRTAFEGQIITSVVMEGEDVNFRLKLKNAASFQNEQLLNLPIANREGRPVRLGFFASLEERSSKASYEHEDARRTVSVTADVDTGITSAVDVNALLREKFAERAANEPGLRMKFGGQQAETAIGLKGFAYAMIFAIVSIYCMLVVLFDNYLQPFMIMAIIPFSIIGVLLTLMIHGFLPITFIALIGMLGLIGVAVNATIVMITHLNENVQQYGPTIEAIANGAKERFRPVILTTLTTFAGLLPTSYGIGGDLPEIRPMVLTMAWGLVFTTIVTLGFTPALYSLFVIKPKIPDRLAKVLRPLRAFSVRKLFKET